MSKKRLVIFSRGYQEQETIQGSLQFKIRSKILPLYLKGLKSYHLESGKYFESISVGFLLVRRSINTILSKTQER